MKKNLFMVAAVALIATVSCNKELENNSVQGPAPDIVFEAELEQPNTDATEAPAAVQTKTSLGSTANGVTAVNWVKDDKIKINGVEFKAVAAGSRTDFTTTSSFTAASTYYAVYPASAAGASDLTKVTIPASQKGTFAEAAISVAKSSTQSLNFKNVASILKFQVSENVSKVTISSDDNIAGDMKVVFNGNGLPEISEISSESRTITLEGTFTKDKDYYVAVLPGTKTNLNVYLDGVHAKTAKKSVTLERGSLSYIGVLTKAAASKWSIVGEFNSWSNNSNVYPMYEIDGMYVAKNIKLKSGGFKMIYNNSWNTQVGAYGSDDSANGIAKVSLYDSYGTYISNASYKARIGVQDWNKNYDIYLITPDGNSSGKSANFFILEAGTVFGQLTIIGNVNGTSWDINKRYPFVKYSSEVYVLKNVNITGDFKIKRSSGNWNESWGKNLKKETGDVTVSDSGDNIKVSKNGTYDVYLKVTSTNGWLTPTTICVMNVGKAPTF